MSREEELVQVDRYLDALLASRFDIREATERDVDADLRTAAVAVRRALPRFHPSFAFEERLAHLLRTAGQPADGVVLAFPARPSAPTADDEPDSAGQREIVSSGPRRAGVLLGGAIASGVSIAGVSIAGAALLARRRGKSPASAV